MNTETVHGIEYSKPKVILLQETGIGTSEYAARTCYDSFEASENECITKFDQLTKENLHHKCPSVLDSVNSMEHSDLLDQLAWTHFHYSILEHANITYLIKGTSRGVLMEHCRHRIQSISVRSTRYTMSSVINAFVACRHRITSLSKTIFTDMVLKMDLFVTTNEEYNRLEIASMWDKLNLQYSYLGADEFIKTAVAKSSMDIFNQYDPLPQAVFEYLEAGKKKRNVGDAFKHIVTDNFKVDMVVTMNIRALKNYFQLRDSASAYFQIRWLSSEMVKATPMKYLKLIMKDDQIKKHLI